MPRSYAKRLISLVESINKTSYSFLIDMFSKSNSEIGKRAYNTMKTQEKNAFYIYKNENGINMSGVLWYMSYVYMVFVYKVVYEVFYFSLALKEDREFAEELKDIPVYRIPFSVPEEEIEGDPYLEYYVEYNDEFNSVFKKFIGRYKVLFGESPKFDNTADLRDFKQKMIGLKKEFKAYMDSIEHFKDYGYRPIDTFQYMDGNKSKSIENVMEELREFEAKYNAKKRDPIDEREEVNHWEKEGVDIDTEFVTFNEKPPVKWIMKPVQSCPYEREFGKNCGNNRISVSDENYFVSLRRKAEPDDIRPKITEYDWDVLATADYNPNNGLMAGCKGVGVNVSGSERFASPNGNLKPSKALHKYYMGLWAHPAIRGFYSDSDSGYASQNNLRPSDLSEDEEKRLKEMMKATFKKEGSIDKYKYMNFFGVKDAIEDKIVKNEKEANAIRQKENKGERLWRPDE